MKTVNFIEAVNSGKRFRTVDGQFWLAMHKEQVHIVGENFKVPQILPVDKYLINCEFVIEEKKVTLTESQFEDIAANVIANYPNNYTATSAVTRAFRDELGF
tara:strand:- start:263 stop:568 length:306 start_codon:yes stop_codon:yes gene_type:complete